MDVNQITTLVGSLGFPIVACIALFLENRAQRKTHAEETAKLSAVIEQNTLAITVLTEKMED